MFWFILVVILFFILAFDICQLKGYKNTCYTFVLILLILYSGLRYRVGIDTIRYMDLYDEIPPIYNLKISHLFSLKFEPLWNIFCSVLKVFSSSFFFMQIIHAIILNGIIFSFVKKYTNYIFSVILLYFIMFFFLFNFETIRESLAIAIFLLSINAFIEKRWKNYYCIAIICCFIHSSAIFLIVLPLFRNFKLNKKFISILLFIIFPLFAICYTQLKYINFIFLGDLIAYKAKVYFNRPPDFGIYPIMKNLVLPIMMLIIGIILKNRNKIFDPFVYLFLFFSFCSIFVPVFIRFSNYFIFFYILFFVNSCYGSIQNIKQNIYKLPLILFLFFIFSSAHIAFYFTSIPNTSSKCYHRYFPYSSILTKKTYYNREIIYLYEWEVKPVK